MIIKMNEFAGMAPQQNPINMDVRYAQSAINTKLIYGNLRPWKAVRTIVTPAKAGLKKTIYRWGENLTAEETYWFSWTTDVDVVRAPIDNDTSERTYFTGDEYPKKTDSTLYAAGGTSYPMNAYKLGIPAPASAPSVAVSGAATNATDVALSVAYVVTYVSAWGEESAPSPPTAVVSYKAGQTVNITAILVAPAGNYNVTSKRIYRSNSGSKGTAFQFVTEIAVAYTTYADTNTAETLGETVVTWGWAEPPEDMKGLKMMANGFGIGFAGNTIYPSEPFALYAYPVAYQMSTESPIVGIGVFGQSAFIGTKSYPYVITGSDPASLSMIKLEAKQACVSKRSIVEMNGGVVYASPDGLFLVNSGGITPLTAGVMSRDDWQLYKPESIHAYEIDGRYIAFYDTGTVQGSLIFNLYGDTPSFTTSTVYATAGYSDRLRDALYLAIGSAGNSTNTIARWDDGSTNLTLTWKSKKFRAPRPICPSVVRIEAESYPVIFKLYGDGSLKFTKTVSSKNSFRLPSGYKAQIFEFQFETAAQINTVSIAEKVNELKAS
jgi:hypothetical protein